MSLVIGPPKEVPFHTLNILVNYPQTYILITNFV